MIPLPTTWGCFEYDVLCPKFLLLIIGSKYF